MSDDSSKGGIGFLGLLQIVFITLKLLKVIAWSWWVVMLPTLIPAAFVLVYFLSVIVPVALKSDDKKKRPD